MVLTNLKQLQELHELTRSQHLDLTVQVVRGDISIGDDISRAISCATKLIKGVVQAAMVLKDTLFTEMSLARFKQVLHPEMLGTIHLRESLQGHDPDFFLMRPNRGRPSG
ncbi:hypothetical protein AFCA_009950 [Aspergillus flavus]|nr:hypothetical protein CA14_002770 [Aspergillus flavus]UDD62637.1 hypothetical protein AFCA_009950 [Aspergillus flavus]